MEENTQLPKEVVEEINRGGQEMLAYKCDNKASYIVGATVYASAYAKRLNEANETIKVLTYNIDKLKGEVQGLKNVVEELKRWKMNAAEELTIVGAYAHKHLEVNQSDSIAQLVMAHLNECRTLLEKVLSKHESGLLPDRFIYEKIKTFLYGE